MCIFVTKCSLESKRTHWGFFTVTPQVQKAEVCSSLQITNTQFSVFVPEQAVKGEQIGKLIISNAKTILTAEGNNFTVDNLRQIQLPLFTHLIVQT